MSYNTYIEDIFLAVAEKILEGDIVSPQLDWSPVSSFYTTITSGKQLTKKQGDYLVRLLHKYESSYKALTGNDISAALAQPTWKKPFRILDDTKSVSVVKEDTGITYVHLKFPFTMKEAFVKELTNKNGKIPAVWDDELRVQKIKLHDVNLIQLHEFVKNNSFEMTEDFLNLVAEVEEIWSHEEDFSPEARVVDNTVELINYTETAENYFESNRKNNTVQDLFLARSMGYKLGNFNKNSRIDRFFSTIETNFWIRNLSECFSFIRTLDTYPMVLFLDRASNLIEDVNTFISAFKEADFDEKSIRVCFRFSNEDEGGKKFNQWIKNNSLGGPISTGKIFICQHKPPKWMFSPNFSPKILISNSLYPATSKQTSTFIKHHHTVFYVGNVKPSMNKENKIVEL